MGLLGNATHAQICAQGQPALVKALMAAPEIAMFGESRITRFVSEFIRFEEFEDAEEQGREDREDIQPKKAARKVETMRA